MVPAAGRMQAGRMQAEKHRSAVPTGPIQAHSGAVALPSTGASRGWRELHGRQVGGRLCEEDRVARQCFLLHSRVA